MKNLTRNIKNTAKSFLILSTLASCLHLNADDTEVFYSKNVSKPNLLFLLDVSGSMKEKVPNTGGTGNTTAHTVDRRVSNSNDDAEQAASGGNVLTADTYLDIGYDYYDFRGPARVGLRFYDMGIPAGAVVTNAYIQFEVRYTDSRTSLPAAFSIVGEAASNGARFDSNSPNRISDRTVTTENVDWNPTAWTSVGDRGLAQKTSDLTTIVQTFIDRGTWSEDNAMVFIIEGKSGDAGSRVAKTFDNNSTAAPTLHIEYTTSVAEEDKTRLEVMQTAIRRVLETAPENVNVGLMKYSGQTQDIHQAYSENKRRHYVSGVSFPISDINGLADPIISEFNDRDNLPDPSNDIAVREYIADIADAWKPSGGTPIVDALYEAALYFRGEKMHYGKNKNNTETLTTSGVLVSSGSHPSTYVGGAEISKKVDDNGGRAAIADANYISPIKSSCQSNYILLMTDGEPTYYRSDSGTPYNKGPFAKTIKGTGATGTLAKEIGSCVDNTRVFTSDWVGNPTGTHSGDCGKEITHYIATHDNSDYDDKQEIKTYTIGFGAGISPETKNYLKDLETIDDDPNTGVVEDGYFDADSPETLAAAFKKVLEQVSEPHGSLASPGYSVSVKSGLEHERDIYIPVFDRKNTSRWTGNLKKFRLDNVGGRRLIRGKNNLNAVDESGQFTGDALDYWSDASNDNPDGINIGAGGVIGKLNPVDRKLYSNIGSNVNLTDESNLLAITNSTGITNAMLGLDSSASQAARIQLINYVRGWEDGYKQNSDAGINAWLLSKHKGKTEEIKTHHMGDMLHAEPLIITYDQGATEDDKEQYIFAGTNEGFLHVFDTRTGEEKFAFMPKELLKNIAPQMRNDGTANDHLYGVDGSVTYWHNDVNKDGKVNTGNGEFLYLYFGLRRGGNSFYALDITNIDQPKFKWSVSRDGAYSSTGESHPTMGQSWSSPYLGRVSYGTNECKNGTPNCREAIIISGGYDPLEDRDTSLTSGVLENAEKDIPYNIKGKDIFIFDAENGDKIWSLSEDLDSTTPDSAGTNPTIQDSIPGGVRIIDTDRDSMIDRLYFGDTGANLWRLDLNRGDDKDESKLTKLAALAQSMRQKHRKFYNEPDVASMKLNGRSTFVVSIGSGFRAHPLDKTIDDKFFMVLDKSPYSEIKDDTFKTALVGSTDQALGLAKITISGAVGAQTITQTGSLDEWRGWEVSLPEDGEKVLGAALTYDGIVSFTTLVPEAALTGGSVDQCAAPGIQSRYYGIKVRSGEAGLKIASPSSEETGEDPDEASGSTVEISIPGPNGEILTKPQIIFNPLTVDKAAGECAHPVDIRIGKKLSQATGYDACRLESVYWSDPVTK